MKNKFSIDARVILTLGRDSIKDHTTALLELVKNSYDADATKVWIHIFSKSNKNRICIIDNGKGMTVSEIDKYWLRIGYSEKLLNKVSQKKRRKTGEKGIGRLSADRLGAILQLRTKSSNTEILGLEINWDDFNVHGKDVTAIPIKTIKNTRFIFLDDISSNVKHGTELIIYNLRQNWTKADIVNLYDELSIFTPPFRKVSDFQIFLTTDIAEEYNKKVISPFYENAEIELKAKFDGQNIIYSIKDRYNCKIINQKIDWNKLFQMVSNFQLDLIDEKPVFGPLELELLFWTRESKALQNQKLRLSDLREFLDKNAGVKIYRDNVRVKPYGNPKAPEGDWLGLAERKTREPAGISRPTWVVAANQVVGGVFISRDSNLNLVDSSSREGLIHDETFHQLRIFVLGCLRLLETHRYNVNKNLELTKEKKSSPTEDINILSNKLKTLNRDLKKLKKDTSNSSRKTLLRTIDQVNSVLDTIPETQKSIKELVTQSTVFRGLATIGIASAVFGHETQSSISQFRSNAYTVRNILRKNSNQNETALYQLSEAIKFAEQVSSWGSFALGRIQRDKRRRKKHSISKIVINTLKDVKPVFSAINIEIITNLQDVVCKTFAMDIEAIILNLLTNAYTACQNTNRKRKILIELVEKKKNNLYGFNISVSDSGPGIDDKIKGRIWEPLFTTKVDRNGKETGTGLGLSIVESIVNDLHGEKQVDNDLKLKGARFTIWLPCNKK